MWGYNVCTSEMYDINKTKIRRGKKKTYVETPSWMKLRNMVILSFRNTKKCC